MTLEPRANCIIYSTQLSNQFIDWHTWRWVSSTDWHARQVRAKYMTLEPGANRYVKYIRNIRAIQDYLVRRADKHCVPQVDNTNVDRSVATIHATVLGCLRRMARVSQNLLFILRFVGKHQCGPQRGHHPRHRVVLPQAHGPGES